MKGRCLLLGALLLAAGAVAETVQPPEGFTALFNGKDLDGWWGLGTQDPAKWMALSAEELEAKRQKSLANLQKHWSVEDGVLVNDGHGLFLTTLKNYADFELMLEYKTVPLADTN